jgi:cytochrome c oxidase subunit 3
MTFAAPSPAVDRAPALDVSELPTYAHSHGSLMWWSTWGLMLIEGTVFAIGMLMYFYLRGEAQGWPIGAPPPGLSGAR